MTPRAVGDRHLPGRPDRLDPLPLDHDHLAGPRASPVPSKSRPALITRGFGFDFVVAIAFGSPVEERPRIRPIRACVNKVDLLSRRRSDVPTLRRAGRCATQS